jgi:hypothetical protein
MFVGLVNLFGSKGSNTGSAGARLAVAGVVVAVAAVVAAVACVVLPPLPLDGVPPSLPQADANTISSAATPRTCVRPTCVSFLLDRFDRLLRARSHYVPARRPAQFPSFASSG